MALAEIGRFKIREKLGSGAQGTVYLCADAELQRRVAVKLLDKSSLVSGQIESAFLSEARTISQIQHPNIVSIFEVGKAEETSYLVFEHVEGRLLSDMINARKLDLHTTLNIFSGILAGLDQVHRQGIVHRDLKPSNIIINNEQVPKIMDFGIARVDSVSNEAESGGLTGTPRYMPPEYIQQRKVSPEGDVFSLGLILMEMLRGESVFDAKDAKEMLDSVVSKKIEPPSVFNSEVDEELDSIAVKATAKNPAERYANAGEMLSVLTAYRETSESGRDDSSEAGGTVDFLLRRMRRKSDFPALSKSIRTLNAMAESSEKSVSQMAGVIIDDYALTNKVLKAVNSAHYSRFAGKIGTISRAVVVLGMQPIRSIAASLIFFEHLHNKAQADRLKALIAEALFSAVLADQIARDKEFDSVEEYFLSAMLHNLGQILIAFYLPEEDQEIERLKSREALPAAKAERTVLGATLEQIGIDIAKQWNFPASITETMSHAEGDDGVQPETETDKRRLIATFSGEAAKLVAQGKHKDRDSVRQLLERYSASVELAPTDFDEILKAADREFIEMGESLSDGGRERGFIPKESSGSGDSEGHSAGVSGREGAGGMADKVLSDAAGVPEDAEALLTEGLQEVTSVLMGDHSLSQVFNVVLETMYRSMGFKRVLLCLRDAKTKQMVAKSGFGDDVDGLLSNFGFPLSYRADVFHAALKNNVDVYIDDASEPKISNDLPDWYKHLTDAGCFILFPIIVKNRALGMIYADHPVPRGLALDKKRLNLLKALRNQIVLAFKEQL